MKKTKIARVAQRQVLDCKARPMLEVDVYTEDGIMGRGAAPTGTSVGEHEAFVLRDGDANEYWGLSVHKAEAVVRDVIAPAVIGLDVMDQEKIDRLMIELDGTPNKEKLGGNSIYSVSIACLRAAAASLNTPVYRYLADGPINTLPLPTFNVINGGKCDGYVQPFNEFILVPYRAADVEEAIRIGVTVYKKLESVIGKFLKTSRPKLGGSYGWVAPSEDPGTVLELMARAVEECGFTDKVAYALDCASSEMYNRDDKTYELKGKRVHGDAIIECVRELTNRFPLVFVEDILDENDWDGFARAYAAIDRTILLGDDLTVTNPELLKRAHENRLISGFILKPNQIGTISESRQAYDYAMANGLLCVPSGRSGGVVGDVIIDISIGWKTAISKNGAPYSGERLEKLNTLLRASSENPGCGLCSLENIIRFA